jgi:hypothetical protein
MIQDTIAVPTELWKKQKYDIIISNTTNYEWV